MLGAWCLFYICQCTGKSALSTESILLVDMLQVYFFNTDKVAIDDKVCIFPDGVRMGSKLSLLTPSHVIIIV